MFGLALAVLVGVSLGLLGGGGSILTVPILVYVLGLGTHEAIATSLLVVGVTSVAALVPHARGGRVRWRTGLLFGATSMLGAYGAGRVAHLVPGIVLLLAFGAMMLVTAVAMMRRKREPAPATSPRQAADRLWLLAIVLEGLAVGAVTGLVGAGGGFLVVPALVLLGGLSMRDAVGTSLLVIAMKSSAALAGYLGSTTIDLGLAAMVTAAAVVGSFGGAALAARVRQDLLRRGFAWFVVVMAVFLLSQEIPRAAGADIALGRDWPWVLALSAVPLLLAAIDLGRMRRADAGGASAAALPAAAAPTAVEPALKHVSSR
ncbi:MAG: sulfite exporter TauE/SafE family protein [Myxococcota bacterium]|nr:sulfite exporter TauE/SafE family protein [Myxococcota bacterium]